MKIVSGNNVYKLSTRDILEVNREVSFGHLIKILAEQEQRRKKLQLLHYKLAAAYCGKYGLQEAKGYCETLVSKDSLNRETLGALLGHIKEYVSFIKDRTGVIKSAWILTYG